MGNIMILKNADFSNNNIGNSKLRELSFDVGYTNGYVFDESVIDYPNLDISSKIIQSTNQSQLTWAKSSCISSLITVPENINCFYGIIPIIVPKSDLNSFLTNKTLSGKPDYSYIYFYVNDSSPYWSRNNIVQDIFDVYAVRNNIFASGNFALVLASFKLTPFMDTVHNFYLQWQSSYGDSAGVGIMKPKIYYEIK